MVASVSQADSVSPEPLRIDADAARKPRTPEDMEKEAMWLAGLFDEDGWRLSVKQLHRCPIWYGK